MNELWHQLEQWLGQHLPEALADLNPGCSDQELDQLESRLGCNLPADFRALYRCHDGQKGETTGLICGLQFLSTQALYDEWFAWHELAADFAQEAEEYNDQNLALEITGESYPIDAINPIYINLKWIPFTHDGGGNHLGIDLDPGSTGAIGQVINFGRDEKNKYVIAQSLSEFFDWMISQYQAGNYQSHNRQLFLQQPCSTHFLDIVPILFGGQYSNPN
jgi:cell wall assembly regulator SMI1